MTSSVSSLFPLTDRVLAAHGTSNHAKVNIPYVVVDAFAKDAYKGNPAVVVLCEKLVPYFYTGGGYSNRRERKNGAAATEGEEDRCAPAAVAAQDAAMVKQLWDCIPMSVFRALAQEICSVEVVFVIPVPSCVEHVSAAGASLLSQQQKHRPQRYITRFFTLKGEMPFCGHASVAAAHILFNVLTAPEDTAFAPRACPQMGSDEERDGDAAVIEFITKGNGIVTMMKKKPTAGEALTTAVAPVCMSLKAGKLARASAHMLSQLTALTRTTGSYTHPASTFLSALLGKKVYAMVTAGSSESAASQPGPATEAAAAASIVKDALYQPTTGNLVLVLSSADAVLQATPDIPQLVQSIGKGTLLFADKKITRVTIMAASALSVSSSSSSGRAAATSLTRKNAHGGTLSLEGIDFVLRLFAPWIGIDEDALSANTQCSLALYWHCVLAKSTMRSFQASARGQPLQLTVRDAEAGEVNVTGVSTVVAVGMVRAPRGGNKESNL